MITKMLFGVWTFASIYFLYSDSIFGLILFMNPEEEAHLFDEITAEIIDVNIATTKIYAKIPKGRK